MAVLTQIFQESLKPLNSGWELTLDYDVCINDP